MIKLPDGASTEERLKAIEARLSALEKKFIEPVMEIKPVMETTEDIPAGIDEKEALIQKATELKLGSPSSLARMSASKLQSLIDGAEA
jgi:hypothetical protein